jgi:muramoyltetrapeptide carboxypeptidase
VATTAEPTVRRPAPLQVGDRVAVVAPSHAVVPSQLEVGLATLRGWGYVPVVMPHVFDVHGHHAGTDEGRLADLQAALDDPDLRAVWVARGGSGLTRIVGRLDWTRAALDPKPIIGLSDVTALLHAAWVQARLVTVHGQFAGRAHLLARYPDAAAHLRELLAGRVGPGPLPALSGEPAPSTVQGGVAEGRLLGGNLSLVAAGIGTPWQLTAAGAIVLLEEVNEPPYALDRALTHLRTSGWLDGVAGVVVGRLRGCEPPPSAHPRRPTASAIPSASASEVIVDRLGDLGVPVLADLPLGHVDRHLALPHGARIRVDADRGTLELLEPATA